MKWFFVILALGFSPSLSAGELWSHLLSAAGLEEVHARAVEFEEAGEGRLLKIASAALKPAPGELAGNPKKSIGWIELPSPTGGWNLETAELIQVNVKTQELSYNATT